MPTHHNQPSKFSWIVVLLIVVVSCQLWGSSHLLTLDYPDDNHPLGVDVLHSHGLQEHQPDDYPVESLSHEHADHVHFNGHPVQGHYTAMETMPTEVIPYGDNHYQSPGFAPPLPPPNS